MSIDGIEHFINSFNIDDVEYNNISQKINDFVEINDILGRYYGEVQGQLNSIRNEPHGRESQFIEYEEINKKLVELNGRVNEIIVALNNFEDANTKVSPSDDESNTEMSLDMIDSQLSPNEEIHHIFLFIAHGEEYNISGNRNYYPFHQPLFNSLGIISNYGVKAYGNDLRENLTLNENIYNILGNCDLNGQAAINGRDLVTVNPLRLQFRYEDSKNSHLGPYMGLFYIKARGGQNNQAELLKMEHIVSFQNAEDLTQVDSIAGIPTDEQHKYTLHNITHGNVYIESNFNDNEWFGWDRVINFIANFYNQGLEISDGERPLIIPGEQTHIRLYTCRAEAVDTGSILGVPTILTEYALYNANAIDYNDNHNLRYFTAYENHMNNFVNNNQVNNNQTNFQVFIDSFVNVLNNQQYQITVNSNMLLVYLLSLIDKNVRDENNQNIFLERVSCIFTDVENNDIEQLFVMMTFDKNGVDEYNERQQDISTFSAIDINMEDIEHFLQGVKDIEIEYDIDFFKINSKGKRKSKIAGNKIYFIGYSSLGTFPCVLFINYFDQGYTTISLAMIYINSQGKYTHGHEKRIVTEDTNIYQVIGDLLSSNFTGIKIIYSIDSITSGGMSNLGKISEKHKKAQKQYNIEQDFKPTVYEFEEKESEEIKQYRELQKYKAKRRAEEAKRRAEEANKKAEIPLNPTIYKFGTPVKVDKSNKEPGSAESGKTDPDTGISPLRTGLFPKSPPRTASLPDIYRGLPPGVYPTSSSDSNLFVVKSPSLIEMEQLNAVNSPGTTPGAMSPASSAPTSPQRLSRVETSQKETTNPDSQGETQREGPFEFGGKKKGKKAKKTKRAKKVKKAKKARKTKKKRSNKK